VSVTREPVTRLDLLTAAPSCCPASYTGGSTALQRFHPVSVGRIEREPIDPRVAPIGWFASRNPK